MSSIGVLHITPFNGYTHLESVIQFIQKIQLYLSTKPDYTAAQQTVIIENALMGAARARYLMAKPTLGARAGFPTVTEIYEWLRQTYHTADIRQSLKDQLLTLHQEEHESPVTFYTRVREMIDLAGYNDAVKDEIAENAFLSGIQPALTKMVRAAPLPLDLDQKVDYAHRLWVSDHPYENIMHQNMPSQLQNVLKDKPLSSQAPQIHADPSIAILTQQMEKLTVNLANIDKRMNQRSEPPQRFYAADTQGNQNSNYQPRRPERPCFVCEEMGHYAKNCPFVLSARKLKESEMVRFGTHPQNNRNQPSQSNVAQIQFQEIFSDNEEDEYDEAYPVEPQKKPERRVPYQIKRRPGRPPKAKDVPIQNELPEVEDQLMQEDPEFDQNVQEMIREASKGPPRSESEKRERNKVPKLVEKKTYDYNLWEDIKNRPANITIKQLSQICPPVKQQLRNGLSTVTPTKSIVQAAATQEISKSSAYAYGQIEGINVCFIVDTGAGFCLMSEQLMKRLGWSIQAPTKITLLVADGAEAVPLGKVKQVPVKFGNATIPIDACVTHSTTYDFILGTSWLAKAKATVDIHARKMRINWRDQKFDIPIDITRGIMPEVQEVDSDEEEYGLMLQENEGSEESEPDEVVRRPAYMASPREFIPPRHRYRPLTQQEITMAYRYGLMLQRCLFCRQPQYCAEHQNCRCPHTTKIFFGQTIHEIYCQEYKRNPPRKSRPQEPIRRKSNEEKIREYLDEHPDEPLYDQRDDTWDKFWDTVKYVGKSRLNKPRWKYEQGCRKPEVDPEDFLYTISRTYGDDYDPSIHGTWSETSSVSEEGEEEPLTVKVKVVNPKATVPKTAYEGDAGFDLRTIETTSVSPGEIKIVPTGLAFEIPKGYVGIVKPRSSLAIAGLTVDAGVIDSGYRDECKVVLYNKNKIIPVSIYQGDKIAQILFQPVLTAPLQEVKELTKSERGQKGFGSSGANFVTKIPRRVFPAVNKREITELTHPAEKRDKHSYKIGVQLSGTQADTIKRLLKRFEHILAVEFDDLKTFLPKFQHDIDTGDARPIQQNPYRVPTHYQKWVDEEIKRLLEAGIIRRSSSAWSSPLLLVPKQGDGEGTFAPRMCIDYRQINDVTYKDAFPLPHIDTILESMENRTNYFTTLDLFAGYYQMGMTPRATERSAFVTTKGLYEFQRMPFGLCNAPASFQRMIFQVFGDMIGAGVYAYIDDIVVFSRTFEEHVELLTEVLKRLEKHNLYIKPKKCTFLEEEVSLLGYRINKKGIKTNPKKVESIIKYPRPTSVTELRSFLGLASFYRRFVPNFSTIASPLYGLFKKESTYKWTTPQETAFIRLKYLLSTSPILARPDFSENAKPFRLYTDACSKGFGAILKQEGSDGQERVIFYASTGTRGAEQFYGATKLECRAVVWAVVKFRHYLIGRKFHLITDHTALRWLLSLKDISGIYARWVMQLQEYDMVVEYRKGREHKDVDAISRIPRSSEKRASDPQ